jgi:hypothetical protein
MAESQFDDEGEGNTGASLTYLDMDYDGADTQVRVVFGHWRLVLDIASTRVWTKYFAGDFSQSGI